MASEHLIKITNKAKQLRRTNPKLKWTDAVKKASKLVKPAAKSVALKKAASSKKKLSNKKIGALPVGFKGSIFGVNFKIVNQYDIYNSVSAIVEDTKTGKTIIVFDGNKSAKELSFNFAKYIVNHFNGNIKDVDFKQLETRLFKFCVQMQKEVKAFNLGKAKTIKKQPLVIAAPKLDKPVIKKAAPKKAAKKVHTIWKTVPEHNRRVAGVGSINASSKRNEIEKELGYYIIAINSIQKSIFDLPIPQRKRAKEVVASYKKIVISLKQNLKLHNDLIKKQLK